MADTYRLIQGKSGCTWIVKNGVLDVSGNIWVTNNPENTTSSKEGFQGYGGATLVFKLEDGSAFEAHGPWHTNPDALYADTGEDYRELALTRLVIGKGHELGAGYRTVITDIVYEEKESVLGNFSRGDTIAQQLANHLGEILYVYSESSGGSSSKSIKPAVVVSGVSAASSTGYCGDT